MRVVVLDVETTGLPPKQTVTARSKDPSKWSGWPYVMQVSWVVVDVTDLDQVELKPPGTVGYTLREAAGRYCTKQQSVRDFLVRVPDGVVVDPVSESMHGLTGACRRHGVPVEEALGALMADLSGAAYIVGHNVDADVRFVLCELSRTHHASSQAWTTCLLAKPRYCTMHAGTRVCRLPLPAHCRPRFVGDSWSPLYKYPRLVELYAHLFGAEEAQQLAKGLHNARTDALACCRCFERLLNAAAGGGFRPHDESLYIQ